MEQWLLLETDTGLQFQCCKTFFSSSKTAGQDMFRASCAKFYSPRIPLTDGALPRSMPAEKCLEGQHGPRDSLPFI